ncbi:MAG: peptide chain release factor N(5)-glutamine methyltransferase [Candidatus Omnitrophica bacterium]|nr:peptide chain release factor N(5)-glutamine methyltransferase [Candidatus Omnitrophota bacterium]
MQPKTALPIDLTSVAELLLWGEEELAELGGLEARSSAERLLSEISGLSRTELYLKNSWHLVPDQIKIFRELIAKRKSRIPVAYLVSRAYFWEEILKVSPDCLIPRPETEMLIEAFIHRSGISKGQTFSFLDLGTGSGAIGIALLRYFENAKGTFSDISSKALEVAEENLKWYGLINSRAEVVVSDLFEAFQGRRWDAIFFNPPYFSNEDWNQVEPEILREPVQALDGGQDGLDFYRRMAAEACDYLNPGGWVILEMGIHQAPKVKDLLVQNGFKNIFIIEDHAGIERVIMAQHG